MHKDKDFSGEEWRKGNKGGRGDRGDNGRVEEWKSGIVEETRGRLGDKPRF
ncbi:MAG: hypothetical protein IMY71_13435 [Bacteroidetes bacterium]|nr:hypothetical protein [Bacteroidota bacterium]